MSSNETRWEEFIGEIQTEGYVWTLQINENYVTSKNRYGTNCFPWWSSRKRVLEQIQQVPAYNGAIQVGFEWEGFVEEWVPNLKQANCLLGINYAKKENVGFDLPIQEVINAVVQTRI